MTVCGVFLLLGFELSILWCEVGNGGSVVWCVSFVGGGKCSSMNDLMLLM